MSTATERKETVSEIRDFFRACYVEELRDRLKVYAEDGELDDVVHDDFIDGGLLCDCDETAAYQVKQQFGWRLEDETMDEAIERPEVYEGIDFVAIIREAQAIEEID